MRTQRVAIALTAATVTAVIAAIVATSPRAEPTASATPSSTASPIVARPAAPRVVFAKSVVLDSVTGGGAMTTAAYDSFEVLMPGGARQSHTISGVAVGTIVFDGRDHVAYWRRAEMTRSPLEFKGPHDVVVWDVRTDQERVLLTLRDAMPGGDLLWSTNGNVLIVPTRTGQTGGGVSRLIAVDVASGGTRVLHESSVGAVGIGALYVDAQVLAGVRGGSYVVLDLATGTVRTETRMRVPSTFLVESAQFAGGPDGMVVELHRRFEAEAGPLWIWNVRDPSADVAKVDERSISEPTFWPGRTEVVFTGAAGQLAAVDYRSGRTRPLVSPPGIVFVEAVEAGGRFALVRRDAGLEIVERIGDELKARPDLALTIGPTLKPVGLVFP